MAISLLRSLVIALLTGALVFSASDGRGGASGSLAGEPGLHRVGVEAGGPVSARDRTAEFLVDATGAGQGSHATDASRGIAKAVEGECDADDDVENGVLPELGWFRIRRVAIRDGAPITRRSEALFYARHARAPPRA